MIGPNNKHTHHYVKEDLVLFDFTTNLMLSLNNLLLRILKEISHKWLIMTLSKQEALLPQRDRATSYANQNLVNCRTSCTTNPHQIEVMELESYSWPTCSKQPRLVDCRIYVGVVNKLDRRRRRQRVLLTTLSTCRGANFKVQNVGQISKRKYPNLWRYPNYFLIKRCRISWRKLP